MMGDLRWAMLVMWLTACFSLQVHADTTDFEADIGGYVVGGVGGWCGPLWRFP